MSKDMKPGAYDELKADDNAEETPSASAPAFDWTAAVEAVYEDYGDVEFDDAALIEAAQAGPAGVKAFREMLKYKTISIKATAKAQKADNPMVYLHNRTDEDTFIRTGRYGSDYAETFVDGEGETKTIGHEQGAKIRGDALAAEGLTNLTLKGKSETRPEGTFFKCRLSLAELIRGKGEGGLEIVADYDPEIHGRAIGKARNLTPDPSNPENARDDVKGGKFIGRNEAVAAGANVGTGPVETSFEQFRPVKKE